MVSKISRKQLLVEFTQSYRLTGQLFFKLLHTAMQKKQASNTACLPILKVLKQGSMSQSAIARELHHSDAAVSRQIGILVDDGLVSTRQDAANRRVTLVELTKKGDTLLGELEDTITGVLAEALESFTDAQLQQFIKNNTQLQEAIATQLGKEPRV